jgi:hypothetical protein
MELIEPAALISTDLIDWTQFGVMVGPNKTFTVTKK